MAASSTGSTSSSEGGRRTPAAGPGVVTADGEPPAPDLSAFQAPAPSGTAPTPRSCARDGTGRPGEKLVLGAAEPIDSDAGVAFRVTGRNALDQQFSLVFTGPSSELVQQEIAETWVCLEVQPFEAPPEHEPAPDLDGIVVDALVTESGREPATLAAIRDASTTTGSPTLADVAAAVGADPVRVRRRATTAARQAYPAVDPALVEQSVAGILAQPDAPSLINPAELPADDAGYDALLRESADTIVVDIDVLDANLPDEWAGHAIAVSFCFDPRVNRKGKRYYRARKAVSVAVDLEANFGRMTVYLWRESPHYLKIGSRYASTAPGGNPRPRELWYSSGATRSYDILVKGWQDGSDYDVYGGWVLES
jgi:hypothetical protein